MANLAESSIWETGVYQIEENDPVHGGANGITNRPTKQLANRTVWLKNELASSVQTINASLASLSTNKADKTLNLVAGNGLTGGGTLQANRTLTLGTPSQITASTTNSVTATSHTHAIDKASTTVAGVVQLVDNLTTDDAAKALTAKQGKILQDNKLDKTANAVSASKLVTARTISTTGDATWSVSFDGSANASGALTLANSGVTAGSYNAVTVDSKGRVTRGLTQVHGLITATTATGTANQATTNANTYLNIVASGVGSTASVGSSTQVTGTNGITVSSDTAGKLIVGQTLANSLTDASTVKALTAAQGKVLNDSKISHGYLPSVDINTCTAGSKLGIWGQGQNNQTIDNNYPVNKAGTLFVLPSAYHGQQIYKPYDEDRLYSRRSMADGSWTPWQKMALDASDKSDSITLDDTNKIATAKAVKTLNDAKLDKTANAASATKLQTPRTINGVAFDGTQNITIYDNTKLASNANAVSASRLATARTISLTGAVTGSVSFDGSANVSIATTLTKAVVKDYNRTINATATGLTTLTMDLVGQVVVGTDGKITQYFHLKQFRDLWFAIEENGIGIQNHNFYGRIIPLTLWTAMPNKVLSVQAQLMRATSATLSPMYTTEAIEHDVAWAIRKQGNDKGTVWIDIGRTHGGASEYIDMFVIVEGY